VSIEEIVTSVGSNELEKVKSILFSIKNLALPVAVEVITAFSFTVNA